MSQSVKGFTLIELLAVITIIGILMALGIVGVSRVIENSRKDTFINTAASYLKEAQKMFISDRVYCWVPKKESDPSSGYNITVASALPGPNEGAEETGRKYYILPISTSPSSKEPASYTKSWYGRNGNYSDSYNKIKYDKKIPNDSGKPIYEIAYENADLLFEETAKSPWGGADLYGYIVFAKDTNGKIQYNIRISDTAFHGHGNKGEGYDSVRKSEVTEKGVTLRSTVRTGTSTRSSFGKWNDVYCFIAE